jgi:hypothetical protein
LGATQAQLESSVRNLANVAENTSAAAGRIMDTDYAAETANLTKAQILQQAATSILRKPMLNRSLYCAAALVVLSYRVLGCSANEN